MTDEDVITRVARIFQVQYFRDRSKEGRYKTPYVVRIRGRRAVELMKQLHPLMSKRRQGQIERAIEGYVYLKGENHPLSKLTEEGVRDVKCRILGGEKISKIARDMKVGQSTIRDIKRGVTWRYVNLEDE